MVPKVNVTVFIPGSSVRSMQDELADGGVQLAVDAARRAYTRHDSDDNVPVIEYRNDFDDAVAAAAGYVDGTDGVDLVVIVTDLVCDEPAKAEDLLRQLNAGDNMVVIVPVSNQGFDKAWAAKLDADDEGPNGVDVITVEGLDDEDTAMAEVGPWLNGLPA